MDIPKKTYPKQWGNWAGRELIQAAQRESRQDKWMLAQAQREDKLRLKASGRNIGSQRQVGHRPPSNRPWRVSCSHCTGRQCSPPKIRRNNWEVRDPFQLCRGNKKTEATKGKGTGAKASWLAVRPSKVHTPPHWNNSSGDSLQTRTFLWYIWQNEKLNNSWKKTPQKKIFKY